jgi:hypothetical protein
MKSVKTMNTVKVGRRGQNGIVIPARVVRATVGALALAAVAIALIEAPEAWRYYKLETM